MKSVVVYVVRVAGSIFAVKRVGDRVHVVRIGTYSVTPPDQRPVVELLRR